jgi:hypothetical protein
MPVTPQLKELLLQSLEHERGGVLVYQTALECVQDEDLRAEWTEYLEQTQHHVEVLTRACTALDIDPGEMTPGCQVVHHTGKSLVVAMKMALAANNPAAAELVACECVVLAETKDHADWELIGLCAKSLPAEQAQVLQEAYDAVEDEEDEHLYHTQGWCRELWLKSLGLRAILPPPEEKQDVKSMMQAAKAKKARRDSV